MALVAGIQAPAGKVMGHAGALLGVGDVSARQKIDLLREAGAVITNHPSNFGDQMVKILSPLNHSSGEVRQCVLRGKCETK